MDLDTFCEVTGRCLQTSEVGGVGGDGGAWWWGDGELSSLDILMLAVALVIVSGSVFTNITETLDTHLSNRNHSPVVVNFLATCRYVDLSMQTIAFRSGQHLACHHRLRSSTATRERERGGGSAHAARPSGSPSAHHVIHSTPLSF